MELDIRNRDTTKVLTFKQLWLQEMIKKIRLSVSQEEFSNEELKEFLLKEYDSRKTREGRIFNNITNENKRISLEQFLNLFLNERCICSGYGVLFKNQEDSMSISSLGLKSLLTRRKQFKKRMEAAERGTDEYYYYRILQLTYKLLANSYYGILGEKNSIFYNPFVQNSITLTGQDLITTAILSMETFLSNNANFYSMNDFLNFIQYVKSEDKTLNILDYIDEPVSKEKFENYVINKFKNKEIINHNLIHSIIENLDDEIISRAYYKNKILEISKQTKIRNLLSEILKYDYHGNPAEEMVQNLEEYKKIIIEFCFQNVIYENRYQRSMKDMRSSVIVVDTDSCFLYLDPFIQETGKEFNLELTDEKSMTIFNIYMNIITDVLKKVFWKLTTNIGLIDEGKPLIAMKPESVAPLYSDVY